MALTYKTYLQLDDLLKLQKPQSSPPEHDEMLFIVIHQVYELWFKLLLHEFDKIKRNLSAGDLFGSIATFQRARTIMKTLVGQLDILETMTPMSFTSFRDRLQDSSGFQSRQFRELEFALGYRRPEMLRHVPEGSEDRAVLERRLKERSVIDHFYDFLEKRGVKVPPEAKNRDLSQPIEPNERLQDALFHLYKNGPDVAILLELMTDFDEGMQEWRYRHVKLVERTIGNKKGTGGSLGVQFLKDSLFRPIFADLWAIRHRL